jgi:putative hydrolase of the HAD superfamily
MIKNIIFDLGDVLINLNRQRAAYELQKLGFKEFPDEMLQINLLYEKGLVTTEEFIRFYKESFIERKEDELIKIWNSILGDLPEYRLSFLKELSRSYQLFLFSNTSELHIDFLKKQMGRNFYSGFSNNFKKLYYSFELKERKPDTAGFVQILKDNNLKPEETLFIDDMEENTRTAEKLGINVWNLIPGKEDVVDLYLKYPLLKNKKII